MTEGDGDHGRLDERAAVIIRAELARVLASDAFRAAPQLSAFLTFIVERTIEGRAAELKGYTIAVEGLGRPADFNPQIDPIVRVEAGRLRRALAQYYTGEGQGSPVLISMPVGGYVPVFEVLDSEIATEWVPVPVAPDRGAAAEAPPTAAKPADRAAGRRWTVAMASALFLGLLALGSWYLSTPEAPTELASARPAAGEKAASPPPPENTAPLQLFRVAIVMPAMPPDARLAEVLRRFTDVLVDALARFDDLVTIRVPPPGAAAPADVDYVFEVSVQAVDGGFEGLGRLRSVRDGRIVWTASSGRPSLDHWQDADVGELARRVATRLMEPFGIIPADARQAAPPPAVRCILQAFDARRTMRADDRQAAQACLEKLVVQDPGFYPAWAHLAIIALGEHGSDFGWEDPLPGSADGADKASLDRALAAALTAIRLAPSGARASQAMMKVQLARGSIDEAIQKGQWALTRNPYDPDIMTDLGALYVLRGRFTEGLPLLQRVAGAGVGRPFRYDFYAFLGAYLSGARIVSENYVAMLAADHGPLGLLAQALRAAADHDEAGLARARAQLREKSSLFDKDPRAYFTRKGFSEEVANQILAALELEKR
ncbi:TPR_REGION domain-containing protein [Hyphomicrobiales bacterium]|nr:TPR_REGION domain-containing protein [Hyphomicrobiales bacterium]CAH1696974.1 TPR_REGION domain-containing protein [Hyphomicrobiales bacterium]CAI0344912.1 TPR_REGION domain-containing protein [Hyphomicrobiales bacterium]